MNSGVELHDSRVDEITRSDSNLRVVFRPAYVHRSEGVPGSDAGWGYLQPVQFTFRGATCSEMGECRGAVSDGEVSAGAERYSNLVPLPMETSGEVNARLEFVSGGVLMVSAEGFSSEALGEPDPNFRERYEG
jgi:hypothetical protein